MQDISLHLMDIMQNSLVVDSTYVEVGITAEKEENLLTVYVKDDGWGMDEETIKKVSDPFYTTRTTRKAGLGIPMFTLAAEQAGGHVHIDSEKGKGTVITATFQIDNIDRKPLGDIAGTITTTIMGHPDIEFHLLLKSDKKDSEGNEYSYIFKTEDVRSQIGEVPIDDIVIIDYLNNEIKTQIERVFGGILDEIIS